MGIEIFGLTYCEVFIMLKTKQNETINIHQEIPAIYIPGKRELPVVLMAHGIMGSKNEYLDTQARISEKLECYNMASLRIDFCGHGDSHRDLQDFSLFSQIQDLADSIQWLTDKKYSSVILLGISFGAPPAIIISSLHSQIVKKCVLIAPVTDYQKTFVFPMTSWGKENFGLNQILSGIRCAGIKLDEDYILSPRVLTDMLLVDIPTFIRNTCLNISIFHGDCDDMVPYSTSKAMCDLGKNISLYTMHNTEHGLTEVGDENFSSCISTRNLEKVIDEICQ
jgi:esterase/lipase